ncbi:MAG: histidine phosphatase family protein [Candidatus Woesearchaeota archaeon]|nr:MAG: histidine phosphatase family protein [Candidatus Woesearchaeota archaeon]
MVTTNLYITRHGKKVKEYELQWTGQQDVPLSPKGFDQAKKLGKKLVKKQIEFSVVVSSPLQRARDTAHTIIEQFDVKPPLVLCDELIEMNHGEVDGLTEEEFHEKYPEMFAAWEHGEDPHFPGGENSADVAARTTPLINKLLQDHEGGNILLVGHKSVNRVILGELMHIPKAFQYYLVLKECKLSLYAVVDGEPKVKYINCSSCV